MVITLDFTTKVKTDKLQEILVSDRVYKLQMSVNKRLDIDKVFTHEFICQSFDQQSEMEAVTKLTAKP